MFIEDDKLPDDVVRKDIPILVTHFAALTVAVSRSSIRRCGDQLGVRCMFCLSMTVRNTKTKAVLCGRGAQQWPRRMNRGQLPLRATKRQGPCLPLPFPHPDSSLRESRLLRLNRKEDWGLALTGAGISNRLGAFGGSAAFCSSFFTGAAAGAAFFAVFDLLLASSWAAFSAAVISSLARSSVFFNSK